MSDKPSIYITVMGRTLSGKTTIMRHLVDNLREHGINVEPNWGIDGEPRPIPSDIKKKKLEALAGKSKVSISEHQINRRGSSEEDATPISVEIVRDTTKGIGVRLRIAGHSLESWYGDLPMSKPKAQAAAARIATELDVEVLDTIPHDHEWVQPK